MRMDLMQREERREAKLRLVEGMRAGLLWRDATARAGLVTSRSTAYGLLKLVSTEGETALEDKRRGYPYKLTAPVREWLVERCRGAPGVSSPVLHREIEEQFGVAVSTSQINRVRAELGVSNHRRGSGGKSDSCIG